MRAALAVLIIWGATGVAAEVVQRSPRPLPNPIYTVADPVLAVSSARSLRPMPRPGALVAKVAAVRVAMASPGLDLTPPQEPLEEDLAAAPPPTRKELRKKKREAASMAGAVCGVPAIKGQVIAPITSKIAGCGVAEPVRITSISGVRLSQAPTIDCGQAVALNTWVRDVVQPAFGGKVVELQVAAHYICRSRNNIKGAKLSEHAKGKAIDISGFVLSSGKVLTVAGSYSGTIRKVHKAACGIFKTTLGPGSDGYHENHLHLDTSARKGGTYCR